MQADELLYCAQVLEEVSHKSESSLWTIQAEALSETSRDLVSINNTCEFRMKAETSPPICSQSRRHLVLTRVRERGEEVEISIGLAS
jgi:hypothetical protein